LIADLILAFIVLCCGSRNLDVLFGGSEGKGRKQHLETKDPFQDCCLYSRRRCVWLVEITVCFEKFRNDNTVWCLDPKMNTQVSTNHFRENGEF
jgi:hypothetical protein